ncbi:MAG: hypothetical protein JNK66_05160 [Chitinophagales bacterium]|nr:hypothetical protein [Chitinophagales bacterium]
MVNAQHKAVKLFFSLIVFLLIVALLELTGYFILRHFTLEGKFSPNHNMGLKIRHYLIYPTDSNIQPNYLPNHPFGFIHNPLKLQNGEQQNNIFGWRGKAPAVEKPDSLFRIVCLGGSTTYGYGINHPDSTYPALLEKVLKHKYPNRRIEVINAGIEGITTFEEIPNYLFKIRYLKADAIIIKSGGNDAADNLLVSEYSPDMAHYHHHFLALPTVNPFAKPIFYSYFISSIHVYINYYYISQYEETNYILAREFKNEKYFWFKKPLEEVLKNRFYYSFEHNFNTLLQEITADSTSIYILPFPQNPAGDPNYLVSPMHKHLNDVNDTIMKKLCVKYSATWLPFDNSVIKPDEWMDICHFNEKGNRASAIFIAERISIP